MTVEILPFEPLATMTSLHIAHRDVVRARVAKDVGGRGLLADVPAAAADHDRELDLPVELLRMRTGPPDRRVRPGDRGRVLREQRRVFRDLLRGRTGLLAHARALLEVLGVIPPD